MQIPNHHKVRTRDIKSIHTARALTDQEVYSIIKSVKTLGGESVYVDASVAQVMIDPNALQPCQRFVQQDKLDRVGDGVIAQAAKYIYCEWHELPSALLVGRDQDDDPVYSHLAAPIVEHSMGQLKLLDGHHRAYQAWVQKKKIRVIVLMGVKAAFPARTLSWEGIRVTQKKPELEDRMDIIDRQLFRDMKSVGFGG